MDRHAAALTELSDRIWAYAEIAFREHRSAAALADFAQAQGFRVERGVAGMPTAFVATYGQGRPVIGVMGEYDALPGLSQKALPEPVPLVEGAAGHGCGHNLFGAASLGAAIAIKEQIAAGRLQGTVVFFGTPAEEDVGGKIYMARDGLFDDVDADAGLAPERREPGRRHLAARRWWISRSSFAARRPTRPTTRGTRAARWTRSSCSRTA